VIERWDRRGEIRFVHFQTLETTSDISCVAGPSCLDAIRFLDRNGGVSEGADAFVALLAELPMGKAIRRLFYLPGILPLARWAYRHLAAHRYRWFGAV
jgi:predicted DCC family thiol-disulfide oxidoreductase YuxK